MTADIAIVTLGCAKNEVDSDKMRAQLLACGHHLVDGAEQADIVILNTCAFITEATEEAISTIFELLELPRLSDGSAKLIVSGCMPSRYGEGLKAELPEVAAFVSCADEHNIASVIDNMLADMGGICGGRAAREPQGAVTRTHGSVWAYLKIADGCDRRCSFCTIPMIKGSYRSLPSAEIVREAAELVQGGARELVLIAQDTSLWGRDIADELPDFAALLQLLATRFTSTWIRVMYMQPQGINDELLAVMARHDNICNYLDIPLQHASARVLREMNRDGDGQAYLQLLDRIRDALPDVALRTTLITGFPGESLVESRELEAFVRQAGFDYIGVFAYSPEEGTVAGGRQDQVPERSRRLRAQRLRDLADSLGFARTAERLNRLEEVLICEYDEDVEAYGAEAVIANDSGSGAGVDAASGAGAAAAGGNGAGGAAGIAAAGGGVGIAAAGSSRALLGRSKRQAPEVDGMVHIVNASSSSCTIGDVVVAKILDCYCYDMDGESIGAGIGAADAGVGTGIDAESGKEGRCG